MTSGHEVLKHPPEDERCTYVFEQLDKHNKTHAVVRCCFVDSHTWCYHKTRFFIFHAVSVP